MTRSRIERVAVIGGGIAGLACAEDLARRGMRVTVLEARSRVGGRIHTLRGAGWPEPVELGAEFVHGGSRELFRLARRAGLKPERIPAHHWGPGLLEIDAETRIRRATTTVTAGARDESFGEMLSRRSDALSPIDRALAASFIEGFDAAPLREISARSVEGQTIEDDAQRRLRGGQDGLVRELARRAREQGATIALRSPVRGVAWSGTGVRVLTQKGRELAADAAVVALPLGVLQARPAVIRFEPALKRDWRALGVGHVVRIVLAMDGRRWRSVLPPPLRDLTDDGFGFLHGSRAALPTWWNLGPKPVVVGWAGGPSARALLRRDGLRDEARASLATLLGLATKEVAACVRKSTWHDWSADPWSLGAYSFVRAGRDRDAESLARPLRRLFFAGEATAEPDAIGTVHGALGSGLRAAREVLDA